MSSGNSTPKYTVKRELKTDVQTCVNVQSSSVHNSQKVKIQKSIKRRMDKQNVYPYTVYIHTVKYYLVTKRNEILIHATIWMYPEYIIMLCERRSQTQRPHTIRFYLYEMFVMGKFIQTEKRLVVAKGWGKEGMGVTTNGHRISFGGEKLF